MSTLDITLAASSVAIDTGGPPALALVLAPGFDGENGDTVANETFQELLLATHVNGQTPADTVLVLRRNDGQVLLRGEDLRHLRLRLPLSPTVQHMGDNYYALDAIPGLGYRLDEATQTLALDAAPELFELTEIGAKDNAYIPPVPAPFGGFLNYDINASHTRNQTHSSGLLELGLFSGKGVGIATFLARNRQAGANMIRLDTTWTHDMPSRRSSLRIGDALSGPGSWGRSVRFGGVQWATNFATQPSFISFPLPSLSGEAVLPSSMELYVNGMIRFRDEVPSGPFSINQMPIVTGQGEVQLVLRDLLGREQVITQDFYASTRLLQKGLHDFSYEMGSIRENYGLTSNDYGRFMAVATHSMGFTDWFTAGVHGELLSDQQTVGLGAAALWRNFGVFNASVAASHSNLGNGNLLTVGFERNAPGLSFGLNTLMTSEHFAQIGLQPGQPAPKRLSRAYVSWSVKQYGSINLNYSYQKFRDRDKFETIGASYNVSLGRLGYLGVSVTRFIGNDAHNVFGFTLTRSLGSRTTANATGSFEPGVDQILLQVQQNLPVGSGFGYRIAAGALDADRVEAGVSAQTDFGTYRLDMARFQGRTSYRGNISGGLAMLGGDIHFNRRVTDSFAVVKVGEFANVRVYADNHVIARTRADGSALVPRMRAYERNPVRIELSDLPLDAQIDGEQMIAVPYFRSGLLLEFPVKLSNGALIRVLLENGDPFPVGSVVTNLSDLSEYPVGLRGEAYLTGLTERNSLSITWQGKSCNFEVLFPQTSDPLPHLGTYTCKGLNP